MRQSSSRLSAQRKTPSGRPPGSRNMGERAMRVKRETTTPSALSGMPVVGMSYLLTCTSVLSFTRLPESTLARFHRKHYITYATTSCLRTISCAPAGLSYGVSSRRRSLTASRTSQACGPCGLRRRRAGPVPLNCLCAVQLSFCVQSKYVASMCAWQSSRLFVTDEGFRLAWN